MPSRRCLTSLTTLFAIIAGSIFAQNATTSVRSEQRQTPLASLELPGTRYPIGLFGPGVLASDSSGNFYLAVRDGVFKFDRSAVATHRIAGTERRWWYSGDGGHAIDAGVNPSGIAVDAAGNLYIADAGNNCIRKLEVSTGVITTIAGNGIRGFGGDGRLATDAQLDGPTGVAVDFAGNIFMADGSKNGTNRIRRVAATSHIITTIAGTGVQGYSGDGGPAILAQFRSLGGLAVDTSGNLYIADNFNNRIRMISAVTGVITTVAGNGISGSLGDGGLAVRAELDNPLSIAIDPSGDLYIADSGNQRIRRVNTADGTIVTVAHGDLAYRNSRHSFPCALALDSEGNLYIADSGSSHIRILPAAEANELASPVEAPVRSRATASGFQINVTYEPSVPAAAQTAFNNLIHTYESVFTTNITVNIDVTFGDTGLGASSSELEYVPFSSWRAAMIANASANPGNTYAAAAAASLPIGDPIGAGDVAVNTANARALGLIANTPLDGGITFSNSVTFEYNGVATAGAADFLDVADHELDEVLGIGSALTGLADNASLPPDHYSAEDYFRYGASGVRSITTNPTAVVYFSYDEGNTSVAQFNQAYSALGNTGLDRNDWIYGNYGCPSATVHVQDAILCTGQAAPVGSGPEITVLAALGYDSSLMQTITFGALSNVVLGVAPFSISATASSGLPVAFSSTTTAVCNVSGSTVTIVGEGVCSIVATQPGNATYAAATPVTQSFTVFSAAATHLVVTAPSSPTAGVPVHFTVTALTAANTTATTFADPVHFTSSDSRATLPGNTTLTDGIGTFTATLVTTGLQTITASDLLSSSISGTSSSISVSTPTGLRFIPVTPCRVVDTRRGNGLFGGPLISAGTARSFTIPNGACGIPSAALAYSFNVAVVPSTVLGYLTVWPTGQTQPLVATLNSIDGRIKSNAAIVPAGTGGAVSVYATNDTQVIFDINGYFVPETTTDALAFYPATPCRLVDTRINLLTTDALVAGSARTLPLLSSTCNLPATAQAYSLNFTVVPPGPVGYLTAWATGQAQPVVATLNDLTGTIVANAAIVAAGTSGSVNVFSTNNTDLVVDLNGYFAPAGTGGMSLYTLPPCRVLDTRQPPVSSTIIGEFDVSVLDGCGGRPSAQAYVFNTTVVPSVPLGYLTMWPQGTMRPAVATLNALDGAITNNMAIVPTNNTEISAYATNPTHLILDLFGYFAP